MFASDSFGNDKVSFAAERWNWMISGSVPKSISSARGIRVNELLLVESPLAASLTAPTVIRLELNPERLSQYSVFMSVSGNS